MDYTTRFLIYITVIVMAIVVSIVKYKQLDKASKIFSILLISTLISEICAFVLAKYYQNNFPVYHFFAPIQLFMVGLYFNYSIESFRKRYVGYYVGGIGIIAAICNSIYLQPLKTLNSYFLLFEGLCTIFMCLYAFNRMFVNDELDLLTLPHFWFTFLLLTFWSLTYVFWGVRQFLQFNMADFLSKMAQVLWIVNIFTYLGIGFVFLFYRKNLVQRE